MRIKTKEDRRDRIKHRIRKRVQGSEPRPRLTVFRSVAHMYVQVVDDMTGRTIASASTVDATIKGAMKKTERGGNIEGAKAIGRTIAASGSSTASASACRAARRGRVSRCSAASRTCTSRSWTT